MGGMHHNQDFRLITGLDACDADHLPAAVCSVLPWTDDGAFVRREVSPKSDRKAQSFSLIGLLDDPDGSLIVDRQPATNFDLLPGAIAHASFLSCDVAVYQVEPRS